MGKKCKNIIIKQGLDDWVMTYGDMMSLLLTFFVLIVSFSSMQETKFEQAAASLSEAFGVMANPESVIEFNEPIMPNHNPQRDAEVLYEVRSVEKDILDNNLQDQIEVEVTEDGVLIRINAPFLFTSGGADLRGEPRRFLDKLAGFFNRNPHKVKIEGHTDDIPINSTRYPSNWDLSAARAVSVARYFQSMGVPPDRIEATGRGEHHPISANDTPEGRAKNRRVEIFLQMGKDEVPEQKASPMMGSMKAPAKPMNLEAEKEPVRPIINPVTGRLGQLPGTQQR